MKFTATALAGVFVIELEAITDERGWFARAWCAQEFADQGLETQWVQANQSSTVKAGTLRGMHYQVPPYGETKLIRCIRGAFYDQIVDLRDGSDTYGQSFGVELSQDNGKLLYVPAGFAHGYLTLEDDTQAFYQVSEYYTPGAEQGIRYDDPRFALQWPRIVEVVSEKDASWPDYSSR
jgi:dTDP-4-dehydrorhamnose 3,5-epimerase